MSFLLLTGIPRSGTTLAAALLDQMDDTVCLSEPDEHVQLMAQSQNASEFVTSLYDALNTTRRHLSEGKPVLDRRRPDGSAVTNYFAEPDERGHRSATYAIRSSRHAGFTADMHVCAKHNALYAAVLPELIGAGQFRIIAMVRDPVSVLASWRSLDLPVSAGKLPAAERYWSAMAQITAGDDLLLTKQIRIYDLICQRFIESERQISILRYEDLLADCTLLAKAAGRELTETVRLAWEQAIDRNCRQRAAHDELRAAVRVACSTGTVGSLLHFYPQYG